MLIISDYQEFNILTFCYIQFDHPEARFGGMMKDLRKGGPGWRRRPGQRQRPASGIPVNRKGGIK